MQRISWSALLWAAVISSAGCGGSGDINDPDPVASIVGTVRVDGTDAPIEGATVSAGGVEATSDVDGSFELTGVPTGQSATIRSERPGFDAYSAAVAVAAGSNTHDIRMTRRSLYTQVGIAIHIPPNVPVVRGVILSLGGPDTRGLATGVFDTPAPAVNAFLQLMRQGFLALAAKYSLAVMGAEGNGSAVQTEAALLGALDAFAVSSGHPELAQAPLLIQGLSGGGPEAYGLALQRPERTIGFTLHIPRTPSTAQSEATRRVPAYVLLAELDQVVRNDSTLLYFEANRAEGALWALAIEPGVGHEPSSDAALSLNFEWMDTILGLRLPATVTPGMPVTLQPVEESSGWLGDRESFAIAAFADYVGNKRQASWLPSQPGAEQWKGFVTPD